MLSISLKRNDIKKIPYVLLARIVKNRPQMYDIFQLKDDIYTTGLVT